MAQKSRVGRAKNEGKEVELEDCAGAGLADFTRQTKLQLVSTTDKVYTYLIDCALTKHHEDKDQKSYHSLIISAVFCAKNRLV